MSYIDIFVCSVPTANRQVYLAHAQATTPLFKEHGALKVLECWGDDVPDGKLMSLPMAVKCQSDETVVFSSVVWPSRQTRDEGMKKFMADPRLESISMPFDGKRMIFGGFQTLVEA
jgi:uncharacterized protein YbaA (DUF1428 family)